ncbi:hypothetical protein D9M70_626360 [compost metagenome]
MRQKSEKAFIAGRILIYMRGGLTGSGIQVLQSAAAGCQVMNNKEIIFAGVLSAKYIMAANNHPFVITDQLVFIVFQRFHRIIGYTVLNTQGFKLQDLVVTDLERTVDQ